MLSRHHNGYMTLQHPGYRVTVHLLRELFLETLSAVLRSPNRREPLVLLAKAKHGRDS